MAVVLEPNRRVVIVTIGGSDIELAAAMYVASEGSRSVSACGTTPPWPDLSDVEQEGGTVAMASDLSDPLALEAAAAHLKKAPEPMGIWINNAGNSSYRKSMDVPADAFQQVVDVAPRYGEWHQRCCHPYHAAKRRHIVQLRSAMSNRVFFFHPHTLQPSIVYGDLLRLRGLS